MNKKQEKCGKIYENVKGTFLMINLPRKAKYYN